MLNFKAVTPNGIAFETQATIVVMKSTEGEIGIMQNHEHLITSLADGLITIKEDNNYIYAFASSGIAKVENNVLCIVVEEFIKSTDLNLGQLEKEEKTEINALKINIANKK